MCLFKVYEFFTFNNILPYDMISITSYYKEGEAHNWFQASETVRFCTNWVEFICALHDWFRIQINEAPMKAPVEKSFKTLVQPIQESNI